VRLASASGAVDFALRLAERAQARGLMDRVASPHLRSFLRHWYEDAAYLAPVSSVWLEFDLNREPRGSEAGSLPLPVVCAQFGDRVEPRWLIDSLLPAMHGSPLNPSQRRLLHRCLDALPAAGRILYAFSLRSRPGDAVRLELCGLDPAAMVAYLERVAAPGAAARAGALIPLIKRCERLHLSFDIASEISPRIGLEGSFVHRPHREPRWSELFDRLMASGLCTPEKRTAVFGWPGYDSLWTASDRWPDDAAGLGGFCVRCLSHLKLVSWPDREPEAKAYLLFQHLRTRSGG